ncbi:MAG TPA: class I SAM-dependent methyltransferase, partial [Puia sp.]|nr:class I SAM-dependent methyltransferase [Puia sp.]
SVFPAYPAGIASLFINQDIGYYGERRLPQKMKIWVAGCGTNQALFTALKFPDAEVLGTDLSTASLGTCRKNADQIGVTNLRLEERSLNEVQYVEEFDYIISTGVVHHNASPGETLSRISRALKKDGTLELMVYNYYHRLITTACQKAIRCFYDASASYDMKREITILKRIMADFPYDNLLGGYLTSHRAHPEAAIADSFLQPVEYSYTIESLDEMASSSNLEYLNYCINQFDVDGNHLSWNMNFRDPELRALYFSLPDVKRWQISNVLMFNDSPMLWFYFQRKDSPYERKVEQDICNAFMESSFSAKPFQLGRYILGEDDRYVLSNNRANATTLMPDDPVVRSVVQTANPQLKMKDVLQRLKIKPDFHTINDIRLKTTTIAYPFLQAVKGW